MKFNFKIQQYQTDAVEAVANVFAGQGFHDKIAYRRDVGDNQPKTYQMTFGADEELDPMNETGYVNEHFFLCDEDMPKWIYAKGAKKEQRRKRDGTEYYFSEGAVQFPEPLDKPSRTMLTSESSVGRSSHVVTDIKTSRLRTLTPLECERLNGFPDDWTNTGMPEKMRYFCMGNALVVPIVERIAKQISVLE